MKKKLVFLVILVATMAFAFGGSSVNALGKAPIKSVAYGYKKPPPQSPTGGDNGQPALNGIVCTWYYIDTYQRYSGYLWKCLYNNYNGSLGWYIVG